MAEHAKTSVLFTSLFWKDTVERIVATVAQVLLGVITAANFNLLHFDVATVGATVGTAAAVALLKAIIASQVGPTVSPASLIKDERGL